MLSTCDLYVLAIYYLLYFASILQILSHQYRVSLLDLSCRRGVRSSSGDNTGSGGAMNGDDNIFIFRYFIHIQQILQIHCPNAYPISVIFIPNINHSHRKQQQQCRYIFRDVCHSDRSILFLFALFSTI